VFARSFLGLSSLLWLGYGLFCFARPVVLDGVAGVAASSTTGTVELRAMYGGLQTALGALLLLGALRPGFTRPALLALAFLCAGLGAARLLGALAASEISSYTGQAIALELGSFAIAAFLLGRRGTDVAQPLR
jgi:hypothetical protein